MNFFLLYIPIKNQFQHLLTLLTWKLMEIMTRREKDLKENNFFLTLQLQTSVDSLSFFILFFTTIFFLTTPRRPNLTSCCRTHSLAATLHDDRHLRTIVLCSTHLIHQPSSLTTATPPPTTLRALQIQFRTAYQHHSPERLSLVPALLSRNHIMKKLGNDDEDIMKSRLKESLSSNADLNFLNVSKDEDDEDDVEE
ncbi:hypothetical protein M9H77_35852 [Catharanthus roseus]|uniref:Uncharacterized protein n=1 Tax=Catharanthus roseus TaxID=4058 RepID=A0ACB9ZUE8_CATRO|nr:hypothetical protein M9H77_35852 [Catharanthus roseus]